jgi:hypothetical protein
MALIVGQTTLLFGNVTTLNWIGAREPAGVERTLGFGAGRLSDGYCIALLIEPLRPEDFQFDGTTLRSGGRMGNPAGSQAMDILRPRVHQSVMHERGAAGYRALQDWALGSVQIHGTNRIAKVLPMKPHDRGLPPDVQYPPGAGGLQWKLLPPGKRFRIALYVDGQGFAQSTTFALNIGAGANYTNRAQVMNYLATAT